MTYYYNHFLITMTKAQAQSCSHSGQCDHQVMALSQTPAIKRQLRKIPPQRIMAELKEYGAWSDTELLDCAENVQRILWITANNIIEDIYQKERNKK
jgi:hypothetical protein